MVLTAHVLCDRVKWYQVVLSVGRSEVRGRVQAATVDAAARLVMRSHSLDFADSASIWLLGRFGVPTLRCGVRCRVPRVPLGVHRLSGERYPFVTYHDGQALPFTPSLDGMARYLIAHVQRVSIPPSVRSAVEQPQTMQLPRHTHIDNKKRADCTHVGLPHHCRVVRCARAIFSDWSLYHS